MERARGVLAVTAGLGVGPLYTATLRRILLRNLGRLRAGDLRPMVRLYAKDVHFVFPGESSWSADFRGKEELERWQQRFLDVGLQLEPHEILIGGPPWRTTVVLHFLDSLRAPNGELVYENTGVIFCKAAWGKITFITVYEDTQKVAALDEYLEGVETVA
ncbi:MAG TPA: nuclear transport factor 2 family protein [Solirubrobacteraceae bacterium]|nr:nuclear transport factor 2 family protein [Solirubrobacteraceae bacterium]